MFSRDALTVYQMIAAGGIVLALILALSGAAWFLIARQVLELYRKRWRVDVAAREAAALAEAGGYDRVWELGPMIALAESSLRRGLGLAGTLAGALPLLGLLGTVLGMLHTFGALSETGSVRVESFADGVSQALITTQAGLLAAIPIIVARAWLASRIESRLNSALVYARRASAARDGR